MITDVRSQEIERKKELLSQLIDKRNERKKKLYGQGEGIFNEEFIHLKDHNIDTFIRNFKDKHQISTGYTEADKIAAEDAELSKQISNLSISLLELSNIPGREKIYYTKFVQTDEDETLPVIKTIPASSDDVEPEPLHFEPVLKEEIVEEKFPTYKMDDDEQFEVMKNGRFRTFFDRATLLIERALGSQTDVCHDYSKEDIDLPTGESARSLDMVRKLFSQRHMKNRSVAVLDWSLMHPELLLASYVPSDLGFLSEGAISRSTSSSVDPDGLLSVWNTKFASEQNIPEYTFHFQSPITSAQFLPYHPNLILGGTFSGRIVIWDNRAGRLMPVQISNNSENSHKYPIFCTKVIGTQNANNIVSVSSDGQLCTWTLDMLAQPSETLNLNYSKLGCISASCLSFIADEISYCVIGSEEGALYTVQRLGSKAGIAGVYQAHNGPVTAVHCHPGTPTNHNDLKNIFLSSSMDWTLKLWSTKSSEPLYCFDDYSECLCDVAWSPVSPASFACIDANGQLDIWNINKSLETPYITVPPKADYFYTKLGWSPQGNLIAAGTDLGELHVYAVENQEFNEVNEISCMKKKIENFKNKATTKSRHSVMNRSSSLI